MIGIGHRDARKRTNPMEGNTVIHHGNTPRVTGTLDHLRALAAVIAPSNEAW